MVIWYDKQGKPLITVDMDEDKAKWMKEMTVVEGLLRDIDYKRVAFTQGKDKHGTEIFVSTVWLGLDQGYGLMMDEPDKDYKPVIFETMVFYEEESTGKVGDKEYQYNKEYQGYQERYSTEKQAKAGHKKAVKQFIKETK